MPQNSQYLFSDLKNSTTNALTIGSLDGEGVSQLVAQGLKSALNQTAAAVIKTGAGRLVRVVILNGGTTGGAFTFNDCATTGAAAASNQIFTIAQGQPAGTVLLLDIPVSTGLVLSAVPTGGSPQLAISYT